MSHTYICTTCDRTYDEIPEDAIKLTGGRGKTTNSYTFPDGSFHSLKRVKAKKLNSSPTSATEPKEDVELVQEIVSTLAVLPTPSVPDTDTKQQSQLRPVEPVIEEDESLNAMQLAWRRSQKEKYAATE